MAGGYAKDDSTSVGLGDYAFLVSGYSGGPLQLDSPRLQDVELFRQGGDSQTFSLKCAAERASTGDAEMWSYGKMLALSLMGVADVGVEDAVGGQVVASGCWYVSASARTIAKRRAELVIRFERPAPDLSVSDTEWDSIPEEPGEYGGTHSSGVFIANGVQLGCQSELRVEVSRRLVLKQIPRCNGRRLVSNVSGRRCVLWLECWHELAGGRSALESYCRDLHRGIGTGPVTVAGNGNAWQDCHLESIRIAPGDHWGSCRFTIGFAKEL